MKKRGIFFMVLVLCIMPIFADQGYTDLGTAGVLEIVEEKLSDAQVNTASTVTVITKEQIETLKPESTMDLLNTALGVTGTTYGGLGTEQHAQIRGASSAETLVYLDGTLITSAHNEIVDLNTIPVNMIDHIEIIKSGAGNLTRTSAVGGIINIITKKGESSDTPWTVSLENGSYLPEKYVSEGTTKQNWRGLVDSQKLDLTYSHASDTWKVLANAGGVYADNGYTYLATNTATTRSLRTNSALYGFHGGMNLDGTIGENITLSSHNLGSYQKVGVSGTTSYPTPKAYQKDTFLSTANTAVFSNLDFLGMNKVNANVGFSYGKTYYSNEGSSEESTHNKYMGNASAEEFWNFGETASLTAGEAVDFNYLDSTNAGQHTRVVPQLYTNGAIYLDKGAISLHPMVNISYVSDKNIISPNASLGAIFTLTPTMSITANAGYAERLPTFYDMYFQDAWGYMIGNENLKTEKGLNGEVGFSFKGEVLSYTGTGFVRDIFDQIAWEAVDPSNPYGAWTAKNNSHAFYAGTEQTISVAVMKGLTISAGYLFNRGFDLANHSLAETYEINYNRRHTIKGSISYTSGQVTAMMNAEYLSPYYYSNSKIDKSDSFVVNANIEIKVLKTLDLYLAIDNLFNAVKYSSSYPCAGTKIRIGGNWKF